MTACLVKGSCEIIINLPHFCLIPVILVYLVNFAVLFLLWNVHLLGISLFLQTSSFAVIWFFAVLAIVSVCRAIAVFVIATAAEEASFSQLFGRSASTRLLIRSFVAVTRSLILALGRSVEYSSAWQRRG